MNRVCSIFAQLLQLFPRAKFQHAVQFHLAEHHARGFTCWGQFVAMLFCQLGQAKSLREICNGLMSIEGKLKHLGIEKAPNKSTLAYANEHRPWQLYKTVFEELLGLCMQTAASRKKKFRFKNKLQSLDSTSIDLCASLFDWAKFKSTKERPRFTCCWITKGTCRVLPISRMARATTSRWRARSSFNPAPLSPWIKATWIMTGGSGSPSKASIS